MVQPVIDMDAQEVSFRQEWQERLIVKCTSVWFLETWKKDWMNLVRPRLIKLTYRWSTRPNHHYHLITLIRGVNHFHFLQVIVVNLVYTNILECRCSFSCHYRINVTPVGTEVYGDISGIRLIVSHRLVNYIIVIFFTDIYIEILTYSKCSAWNHNAYQYCWYR